jgi:LmbE family N-acetylglucosaminyl deacetylase
VKRRLAAVFAHPDDDTFNVGGSVIRHGPGALELTLVVATSGEAGLIFEPSLATRDDLGQVREAEQRAALAVMGFGDASVRFLRHPDGELAGVDREPLVEQVAGVLRETFPRWWSRSGPRG